jgi:ZIP family zinc transporter
MLDQIAYPLLICSIAGLSTGLGGLIVLLFSNIDHKTCARMIAFAAGVMFYVSIFDILPEVLESKHFEIGSPQVFLVFLGGMILFYLVWKYVPEITTDFLTSRKMMLASKDKEFFQTGMTMFISLSLHNLPEGAAVLIANKSSDGSFGWRIALAIMLHNIPEGICLAAPLYAATRKKWIPIKWSFLSGSCEPLGAILLAILSHYIFGEREDIIFWMLLIAAGMMFATTMIELLPSARKHLSDEEAHAWALVGALSIFLGGICI